MLLLVLIAVVLAFFVVIGVVIATMYHEYRKHTVNDVHVVSNADDVITAVKLRLDNVTKMPGQFTLRHSMLALTIDDDIISGEPVGEYRKRRENYACIKYDRIRIGYGDGGLILLNFVEWLKVIEFLLVYDKTQCKIEAAKKKVGTFVDVLAHKEEDNA